ncbi:MAG TPA: hypothetical protein VH280_11195 [Verrucomicrobiae bacterium]|jgi:hypothetical protein|nr:hypothetical protein [Verrucomicrobiae bacterium]
MKLKYRNSWIGVFAVWIFLLMVSAPVVIAETSQISDYPEVPQSAFYAVTITGDGSDRRLPVFESSCPNYQPGYMNMMPVDQHPLKLFHGRSINWVNFSFSGRVTIEIHVLDGKIQMDGPVKVFPSDCGVTPVVNGNVISFTLTRPGQYSVEIGEDGYKNGLLIFANPLENAQPDPASGNYFQLTNATPSAVGAVPASYSGIYFHSGVHDIGVYHIPSHIKNIYFEPSSWVYGALVMDGNSGVKIFGRGVLSGARLNYRQSHMVEAVRSDRIDLEGIVIADTKFFAVRLLGTNNVVKWVKIVGGWTYNTDGIAAFAGSRIAHCFIWANDDSLKPYRDDLTISDCVIWQLNNGAVIQLGWGNARAANVTISNVDILRAEWNNNAANRGIVSCIGDKFAKGGMVGSQDSFVIKNVRTETPVPFVFNIRPNPASPDRIHGMTFKNWNIVMEMSRDYPNYIECEDGTNKFDGFVFDNFTFNGAKLTESNWIRAGHFVITNLVRPKFISDR